MVTSDLSRATATARVIADALSAAMVVDSGLREEALGPWEGLTREEAGVRFPERYEDWLAGRSDAFAGREGLDRVAREAGSVIVRGLLERSAEGIVNVVADRIEVLQLKATTRSRDFR